MTLQLPSEIVVERFLPTLRVRLAAGPGDRGGTPQGIADRPGGAHRLLYTSHAARDASRAWHWLCRSQHEASDGKKRIDFSTAHFHPP